MAIYRAYIGGKEVKEFIAGDKSVNQLWGGDTLLWEASLAGYNGEYIEIVYRNEVGFHTNGDVSIYWGDGKWVKQTVPTDRTFYFEHKATTQNTRITARIKAIGATTFATEKNYGEGKGILEIITPFPRSMATLKRVCFINQIEMDFNRDDLFVNTPAIEDLSRLFEKAHSATVGDLFTNCRMVKNLGSAFFQTKSVRITKKGIFRRCRYAEDFSWIFYNAEVSDLSGCEYYVGTFEFEKTSAKNFKNAFHGIGAGTAYVKPGLFSGCSKVTTFYGCFERNDAGLLGGMSRVEAGAFSGCISAKDFSYMFYNTGLENVDENAFDDCISANDFSYCFKSTSKAALDSAPKLWEKFPDATGRGCYAGQLNLPWYNEIPSAWK